MTNLQFIITLTALVISIFLAYWLPMRIISGVSFRDWIAPIWPRKRTEKGINR